MSNAFNIKDFIKKPLTIMVLGLFIIVVPTFGVLIWAFTQSTSTPLSSSPSVQNFKIAGERTAFNLRSQNGDVLQKKNLYRHYVLVVFGKTSCGNSCAAQVNSITNAVDVFNDEVQPLISLFISTNSTQDRQAVLEEFVKPFGPRLLALTGRQNAIDRAKLFFQAPKASEKGIYLMGPGYNWLGHYTGEMTPQKVSDWMRTFIVKP